MSQLIVVKSNEIVEASYKLTLNEQRLMLLAISKIANPKEALASGQVFKISGKDFSTFWNLDSKEGYKVLKKASENLIQRYARIKIHDDKDPEAYLLTNWISSCKYQPSFGEIEICFADKVLPFLSQIKGGFTKYSLAEISGFKSIYGIRLYEMILQWKNSKKALFFKVKDLRERFQLEEKQYKLFKDFRVYCIEKGVKDINSHSSYQVTEIEYLKTGRSITDIEIHFCLKSELKKKKKSKKVNQALLQIREDLDKPKELKKIFSEETLPIFKIAPSD